MSVVFPAPLYPTTATNSPSATFNVTSRRTSVRACAGPNDLLTPTRLSSGIGHPPVHTGFRQIAEESRQHCRQIEQRVEVPLDEAHDAIEEESDHADGENRKDDVLADAGVIFLPEKPAHARP